MKFFKTKSLDEAMEEILSYQKNELREEIEIVDILSGLNRELFEDIISKIDLPSFNRSTVDGYGVRANDIYGASEFSPIPLKLVGESQMGIGTKGEIKSGECYYIPTGAMLPQGSDSVVMIEDSEELMDEILINKGISQYSNMILKGSEIKKGELVIKKGEIIKQGHIGVLASLGIENIKVKKKKKFTIISTGDEIINLGEELKIGEVYDINTHLFRGAIEQQGGEVKEYKLVRDDLDLLEKSIKKGLESSDVVIISGGSSVGVRDFTVKAIEKIGGEVFIHGLSIKPGKPTIVARYKGKIIFGLPGHPQSGLVVFKNLVEKIYFSRKKRTLFGELTENVYGDPGKLTIVNVSLNCINGKNLITPILGKSSMIRPIMLSDGYIKIPTKKEGLYKGEIVEVELND